MQDHDPPTSPNARFLAGNITGARVPRSRIGNALSASLLTHAAGFLLVAVVVSRLPDRTRPAIITPEMPPHITWIAVAGLGGGGNSGNQRPEPARRAELPGRERLTVPVTKPEVSAREAITDPSNPEQRLLIPAITTMAGLEELPGVISKMTPVTITDSQGPGIGVSGGPGKGSGDGPGDGPGLGPGRNGGTGGDAYPVGNGVVPPRLIREIRPGYTSEAMRARIQGLVTLQAVVLPDGSVGAARVVRSLDSAFGLDQEAVKTVKLWRFMPGTLAGRAVAVLIEIELTFTLR
jgi:periplasmic protein TonB